MGWVRVKLLIPSLIFLLVLSLIPVQTGAANYYTIDWYTTTTDDSKNPTIYTPNASIGDMNIETFAHADLEDTSFSATVSYYSPHATLVTTSTRAFSSNQSCITFGSSSASDTETRATLSTDATFYDVTLHSNYQITPAVQDITFYGFTSLNDSSNNMLNEPFFIETTAVQNDVSTQGKLDTFAYGQMLNHTKFNECNSVVYPLGRYNDTHDFPTGTAKNWIFSRYFIFNSSASGLMNYTYEMRYPSLAAPCGTFDTGFYRVGYYKYASDPVWQDIGTSQNANGELTLDANTVYIFQMTLGAAYYNGGADENGCVMQETLHNDTFTINTYVPSYTCGDWSDCLNGSQYRNCEDDGGISPDTIEYQGCYSLPDETYLMGFENSTAQNVFYSYPSWWVVSCPFSLGLKSVNYPIDGWEVNNISNPYVYDNGTLNAWGYSADNIAVTDYDSVEGTSSLKLWSLSPQQYLPLCPDGLMVDNKTCELSPYGNYTYAQVPKIQKDFNETYLLSRDISFDYPNMTLSLEIRKCDDPVQEWAGNTSLFGLCGNGYYTADKSDDWDIPDSRLFLSIWDYNNSVGISYVRFIASSTDWSRKEVRLENLSTENLYRFMIGIEPETYTDTEPYCLYVDNMELNAYSGTVPCESYCIGATRYEARAIGDYGCVFDITTVSTICEETKYHDEIDACLSYCDCETTSISYLNYNQANNASGECNYDILENSDYCSTFCTEEDVSLIDPSIVAALRSHNIPEGVDQLFSLQMILIYIAIIIMVGVTWITKRWEAGVISLYMLLIGVGTLYPQFAWLVALIIIGSGVLFAKMLANAQENN